MFENLSPELIKNAADRCDPETFYEALVRLTLDSAHFYLVAVGLVDESVPIADLQKEILHIKTQSFEHQTVIDAVRGVGEMEQAKAAGDVLAFGQAMLKTGTNSAFMQVVGEIQRKKNKDGKSRNEFRESERQARYQWVQTQTDGLKYEEINKSELAKIYGCSLKVMRATVRQVCEDR